MKKKKQGKAPELQWSGHLVLRGRELRGEWMETQVEVCPLRVWLLEHFGFKL